MINRFVRMKKYTLLLFTLLVFVSSLIGMSSGDILSFSDKFTGLIAENPGLSLINTNRSYKVPLNSRKEVQAVPDSSRFTRIVLAQGFDEPMAMAILPNNDVLLAERKGSVKIYNRETKQVKTITNLNVFSGIERD